MQWQIGDRATILCSISLEKIGTVVTITSGLVTHSKYDGQAFNRPHHYVDFKSFQDPSRDAAYYPEHLGPIPDDRISSWDELEKIIDWNPRVTVDARN